jgi:hypothetical protein
VLQLLGNYQCNGEYSLSQLLGNYQCDGEYSLSQLLGNYQCNGEYSLSQIFYYTKINLVNSLTLSTFSIACTKN